MHPGYGFLAERADFAAAVEDAGLRFVGPKPEHIALMGDKARAREAAEDGGVPTIPGSDGAVADADEARDGGRRDRLPGDAQGGRRRRRPRHPDRRTTQASCDGQFKTAAREAAGAFDDARIYVERFVTPARHVEVQVLGDGERDDPPVRARVLAAAPAPEGGRGDARPGPRRTRRAPGCARRPSRCADAVGYRSAGTVEFLVDDESGEFFFIEMNTRIQVEHPVTEMITGIDLVAEQLRIAAGEPLRARARTTSRRAAARSSCASTPRTRRTSFLPSPGPLDRVRPARRAVGPRRHVAGAGRRGPAVLRLAAGQADRLGRRTATTALARARRALRELEVEGVKTTTPLLAELLDEDWFGAGRVRHRHARGVAGATTNGSAGA